MGGHLDMKRVRLRVVKSASDYNLGAIEELPEVVGSQGILHAAWIMQIHFQEERTSHLFIETLWSEIVVCSQGHRF